MRYSFLSVFVFVGDDVHLRFGAAAGARLLTVKTQYALLVVQGWRVGVYRARAQQQGGNDGEEVLFHGISFKGGLMKGFGMQAAFSEWVWRRYVMETFGLAAT